MEISYHSIKPLAVAVPRPTGKPMCPGRHKPKYGQPLAAFTDVISRDARKRRTCVRPVYVFSCK